MPNTAMEFRLLSMAYHHLNLSRFNFACSNVVAEAPIYFSCE